jgi:hypothetical protein
VRVLLLSGALSGFPESIAVALDLDDLGTMHEAVDERDRARSVREAELRGDRADAPFLRRYTT